MKREEQIRQEAGCLSDFAIAHGAPWKEYQKGFIDGAKWADEHPVKPSLPSDLYEAAEKNFETMEVLEHENIFEETHNNIFKAGAEWMAGQGVIYDCRCVEAFQRAVGGAMNAQFPFKDLGLKDGDEVIIQIRKK